MTENETTEYKKSLAELGEGLVSIAVILNKHATGELWFGIKNDGTPIGLEITAKTLRNVSQSIAAHIEPRIYPCVTKETVGGKMCLKITFSGYEIPYYAYGRAYMRVSDEDRKLSAKEIENIILRKNRSHQSWDTETSELNKTDIDPGLVKSFLKRAGLPETGAGEALSNLGLRHGKTYINATRLFFACGNAHRLRCAVFAGTTSSTILDQHNFKGDILRLIEDAQRYILQNIHFGMRVDGLERVEVPEVHPEAIREAVINAFCHRDYRDPEDVRVAIFKDRIEIRNPGGLMEGVGLEDLLKGNFSRRRNPLVAELLRRVKLVEAWGRGVPLILEKEPGTRFELKAGLFITRLPKNAVETTGETTGETTKETTKETTAMTAGNRGQILALLEANPDLTLAEVAKLAGLTADGVHYHVKILKKTGKLKRLGSTKAGRWQVVR